MSEVITPDEIEYALGIELSPTIRSDVVRANLRYSEIDKETFKKYLEDVDATMRMGIPPAGQHRKSDWEEGWEDNLSRIQSSHDLGDLTPLYHGKHSLMRWMRRIIDVSETPNFDYKLHRIIVDFAIESWLSSVDTIMEFGCGPAHNLLCARRFNPNAKLVGLDWAQSSQDIIKEIVKLGIDTNITGRSFDFFNPDYSLDVPPNSGVLTVASLEQVGDCFEPFLWWLLKKRPSVCVHLEPIDELMNPDNILDNLSLQYCRKRNYLHGFLTRLRQLQRMGLAKIRVACRTWEGSYFLEGHSLVVWYTTCGENNEG